MNLLDLARSALADFPETNYSDPQPRRPFDPATLARRDRALAILAEQPERLLAVLAVAPNGGNPGTIGIAIRGVAYGELEIPAERYDPFALLALMEQYGSTVGETIH